MKALVALVIGTLPLLGAAQPSGTEIRISAGDCKSGVKLVARNAPLSEVLQRLAQSLDFQLQFEGNSDSLVNLNIAMPAPELLAKLTSNDAVIVTHARDRRCPAQYRIVKVWVLPRAGNASAGRAPSAPSPVQQSARYEEMSRKAKEAYEEYVRVHGRPPPGEPEEIGNPK